MVVIFGKKQLESYLSYFGMTSIELQKYRDSKEAFRRLEAEKETLLKRRETLEETVRNINETSEALKKLNAELEEKNANLQKELKERPARNPTKEELQAAAESKLKSNASQILENIGSFAPKCDFNPNAESGGSK